MDMGLDAPASVVCQELGASLVLTSCLSFALPLELTSLSSAHVPAIGKNQSQVSSWSKVAKKCHHQTSRLLPNGSLL